MLRQLIAVLFGSVLVAQTFVVDAQNGPGTHFLDIAQALSVVPDAAVLVVRPGSYGAFAVVNRGVTIVAGPGVHVTDGCSVSATTAAQTVTLRGLTWPTASIANGTDLLRVANCAGPVLLDSLTMPGHYGCSPGPLPCTRNVGVQIQGSTQVVLRDSTIACTAQCTGSSTVVESCQISGEDGSVLNNGSGPWLPARAALAVFNATVQIAGGSQIRGGSGAWGGLLAPVGANASGIGLFQAQLRVLDGVVAAGQTVGLTNGGAPAILALSGSPSSARLSPRATLQPTPYTTQQAVLGVVPVIAPMPQLTSVGTPLGASLIATVATEPGDLVILLVGFAGAPTTVPGFADPFWLDATLHWFLAIAVQSATGGVTGSIAIPNQQSLLGFSLRWQAAVFGPVTGMQASNPSVGLVR